MASRANIEQVIVKRLGLLMQAAGMDGVTIGVEFLDANDWTSTGWTGSWAAGWAHTTGTNVLSQAHAAVVGVQYRIVYTVTGYSAGSFTVALGGQSSAGLIATGEFGLTASSVAGLTITPTNDFAGTIVVSVCPCNVDLNDPIGYALRQMGYTTADITLVLSAEVASVSADKINKLLDVIEKRCMDTILQNLNDMSVFVGPKGSDLARLTGQLQSATDRKL